MQNEDFGLNSPETLTALLSDERIEKTVMPARLDGNTEVQVLVADISHLDGVAGVVPVAMLITSNVFDRVTPATPGFVPESTEAAIERILRHVEEGESA